MTKNHQIVGAALSQYHGEPNMFEFLIAYADGREIGYPMSREAAQRIAGEFHQEFLDAVASPSVEIAPVEISDAPTINEAALDSAAREGYAVRCKTHGPRVLFKYASEEIMAHQLASARTVVGAYLSALKVAPLADANSPEKAPGSENYAPDLVAAIMAWSPGVKEITPFVVNSFLNRIECDTMVAGSIHESLLAAKPAPQLGGKPEDLRNALCAVIELFGLEGAQKVTEYVLNHRGTNAFDGTPAAQVHGEG